MSSDVATRLDYLRARYYDAAAGRFTTRDSYDGRASQPIARNHYLYANANANPVSYTDPSGLMSLSQMVVVAGNISLSVANHRVTPRTSCVESFRFLFEAATGNTVFIGSAGATVVGKSGVLNRIVGGLGTWISRRTAATGTQNRGRKVSEPDLEEAKASSPNHQNQAKAFPGIPYEEGVAIALEGRVQDTGRLHRLFHEALEQFWRQFRPAAVQDLTRPRRTASMIQPCGPLSIGWGYS